MSVLPKRPQGACITGVTSSTTYKYHACASMRVRGLFEFHYIIVWLPSCIDTLMIHRYQATMAIQGP